MWDEGHCASCFIFSRSSTATMHKSLMIGRIIKMNDIFNLWDIQTSRSNICDNQNGIFLFPEVVKSIWPLIYIHFSINSVALPNRAHKRHEVIHMKTSWCEDNYFFLFWNLLQNVQQSTCFLFRAQDESIKSHRFWQGYLLMNITVFSEAALGEITQIVIYGGTKHQSLRYWAFLEDLL